MKKWMAYLLSAIIAIAGAAGVIVVMSACATSQTILPPEQLMIQEVIEVEGKSQDDLYVASMEWMAKTFKSSKAVIQYEDKEAGKIVGKGLTKVTYTFVPIDTWFTLTIEAKDNKVRVTFGDMYTSMVINGKLDESPVQTQVGMDKIKPEVQKLIISLSNALGAEEEEW